MNMMDDVRTPEKAEEIRQRHWADARYNSWPEPAQSVLKEFAARMRTMPIEDYMARLDEIDWNEDGE